MRIEDFQRIQKNAASDAKSLLRRGNSREAMERSEVARLCSSIVKILGRLKKKGYPS